MEMSMYNKNLCREFIIIYNIMESPVRLFDGGGVFSA